jgi:hypothetical protein
MATPREKELTAELVALRKQNEEDWRLLEGEQAGSHKFNAVSTRISLRESEIAAKELELANVSFMNR